MILLHNMHVRTLSFELFNEASDNTKDESSPKKLESALKQADFSIHLATP